MKHYNVILVFTCLLLSSLDQVKSLKCRTGNQQSDDQFQKIMQVCRRRLMGYDRNGNRDFNGRDTDSQESSDSDSDEDMFDNKFLSSGGGNRYNKYDKINSNGGYDYAGSSPTSRNMTRQASSSSGRNWSNRSYSSDGKSSNDYGGVNSNRRNTRNAGSESRNYANSDSGYSNRYNNKNNMNRYNSNRNNNNNNGNYNDNDNDSDREQGCITQCFFNELNLVDQRGFPERSAVTNIMIKSIQDPELRDFVEESVIECFHYLSNNGRQEKCQFSQNLLTCLAEKGSERCEDWDDD